MSEERDTAPSGAAAPPGAAPEIALPERVENVDGVADPGLQPLGWEQARRLAVVRVPRAREGTEP